MGQQIGLVEDRKYEGYFRAITDVNGVAFESRAVRTIENWKEHGFEIVNIKKL